MAGKLNDSAGSHLAREAEARLPRLLSDRLGVHVTTSPAREDAFDFVLSVRTGHTSRRLYVEAKTRVLAVTTDHFAAEAAHLIRRDPRAIPLLVTPRLTPKARGALRERGVNHADFTGTVFIRAEGLIVDVAGDPDLVVPVSPSRINPFADKASLVIRAFLARPGESLRVTDVATRAGVTKGWVSLVAADLEKRGYLIQTRARYQLADPVRVLHDWSTRYSWRDNRAHSFVSGYGYSEIMNLLPDLLRRMPDAAALTLLTGAELYAPHVTHEQVHLYVRGDRFAQTRDEVSQVLFLQPTDVGGTVHLVQPYYARSAFFDQRSIRDLPVVSPIQLYLDLLQYPLRGREAADMLVRTTLTHDLSLSREQVRELS